MQIINKLLPKQHTLVLSSDWHYGNNACSTEMIESVIDRVAEDDSAYLALGGDQIEAICVDDPRFDADSHIPRARREDITPLNQTGYLADLLRPIADKIVVINHGNHEDKLFKIGNFTKMLCDELGVQYGTYTSKIHVDHRVGNTGKEHSYSLLYWHGYGSANSRVDDPRQRRRNMLRSIRRKMRPLADDCDVMCMGHIHKLLLDAPEARLHVYDDGREVQSAYEVHPIMEHNGRRIVHPDARFYAVTGTALKTQMEGYTTYSEKAGYSPVPLGWTELHYDADSEGRGIDMELVFYK